jgi:hypothetical protein
MATRKKKETKTMEMPGTIGGAKIILPVNMPSGGWPIMNQGSHLTVKTFEDGRTELIWDDEALLRDVRDAILSVESSNSAKAPKKKATNGRSKTN